MENYVYILRCADDSLYTGWTNNLEERVRAHNNGTASKCTRARLPVELVYSEACENKSAALRREIEIKKMGKRAKERLIG